MKKRIVYEQVYGKGKKLIVKAVPGNSIVMVDGLVSVNDGSYVMTDKKFVLFSRVRRRYTQEFEDIFNLARKEVPRVYKETIDKRKKMINNVLEDVYVVIPRYKEKNISEIILIINQELHDQPNDVVAVEICKRFGL